MLNSRYDTSNTSAVGTSVPDRKPLPEDLRQHLKASTVQNTVVLCKGLTLSSRRVTLTKLPFSLPHLDAAAVSEGVQQSLCEIYIEGRGGHMKRLSSIWAVSNQKQQQTQVYCYCEGRGTQATAI
jgi:hypothetical protein